MATADFDHDRDVVEALAEEYARRIRQGEQPSIEEFAAAHPNLADAIRKLFPTVAALEQMRRKIEQPPGGRAGPGPAPLAKLGDFRLIREIGRGGMGVVYEAHQESLGRRVAVKVLPKSLLLERRPLERFQREAKTAARLHHTNIVPVLGVGQQEGYYYYVMQFIDGIGLDDVIGRMRQLGTKPDTAAAGSPAEAVRLGRLTQQAPDPGGLLDTRAQDNTPSPQNPSFAFIENASPAALGGTSKRERDPSVASVDLNLPGRRRSTYWREVADLIRQAAEALAFAHLHGTLHRDVKPANLLLDRDGTLWVADFGVAKAMEEEAISRTGDVVGTLRYMAPEQLQGRSDARSDVYSLGLTLYELLTLEPAFDDGAQKRRALAGNANVDLPSPRKKNPAIPRDLETIVLRAAAFEPERRYASAADMAADLTRFLEDRPIEARRLASWERAWRWARRNPAVASLSLLTLLSLSTAAVVATLGYARTTRALARESQQRTRAESVLEVSLDALDRVYERSAAERALEPLNRIDGGGTGGAAQASSALSPEAASLLADLLTVYDRFVAIEAGDVRLQLEAAKAARRMGDIHQRLGQFPEAEQAYRRALARYAALKPEIDDPVRLLIDEARIHDELGNLYRTQGNDSKARAEYVAALSTLDVDAATARSAEWRYTLARTHYQLGKRRGAPHLPEVRRNDHGAHPPSPDGPPHREGPPHSGGRPPGGPPPDGPPRNDLPSGEGPPPNEFGPLRRPPPPGLDGFRPEGRGLDARGPGSAERLPPEPPDRDIHAPLDPEAELHLGRAIALLSTLRTEAPDVPEYARLLALCYREQVDEMDFERIEPAAALLAELVAEHPHVDDYRFDLCETLSGFDVVRIPREDYAIAEKRLREAHANVVQLDTTVPAYVVSRVHIEHKLSTIVKFQLRDAPPSDKVVAEQRHAEALAIVRSALAWQKRLLERYPNDVSNLAWRARITKSTAMMLGDHGRQEDFTEATKLLREAVVELTTTKIAEADRADIDRAIYDLAVTLARTCRKANDSTGEAEAEAWIEKYEPFGGGTKRT